ncbi:hypothetical protein BDZ89DRAFT_484848 [Hymenopellis radicata]|nr:hypothetical protein BDZ89DRAFT_484848 [Hymenopellis radicata]
MRRTVTDRQLDRAPGHTCWSRRFSSHCVQRSPKSLGWCCSSLFTASSAQLKTMVSRRGYQPMGMVASTLRSRNLMVELVAPTGPGRVL